MRRLVYVSLLCVTTFALGTCKDDANGPTREESDEESEAKVHSKADSEAGSEAGDEPDAPTQAEPLPVPGERALEIADSVNLERYEADLRLIAAERPPGSAHWKVVQDHCATQLAQAGFTVERFNPGAPAGVSVIGSKIGSKPKLPALVVGAHYEHIEGCPGADDNASGTAAALELARVLGPESWPSTLVVACWDEEESGLNGSRAWVDAAVGQGREIALYLNLDAMAYADPTPGSQTLPPGIDLMFAEQVAKLKKREFRADFIAILGDTGAHLPAQQLLAQAERLDLPIAFLEVPGALKNEALLADLRRSDHANFWRHDIPALFLSDTAEFRTDTYHCRGRPDTVETLDLAFATKVVRAAAGMLAEQLQG